jgi:succinyl-CoA synthetase alpha subunit
LSVIISKETKLMVRGITGNEGRFHTSTMKTYGTNIVSGVVPGKGGQEVEGVPVFNDAFEAVAKTGANTSVVFVPARATKVGVLEDIEAGIKNIVIITEGVPQIDEMEIVAKAKQKGVTIVGPNCPGLINPHLKVKVGILPGRLFVPGKVGIISRSGTLTYEVAALMTSAGIGQSTCIGMGGDPIIGLDYVTLLEMFKNDPETDKIVLIGEIGGNAEENAAKYIRETKYPKQVVAYIAGRMAPPGKRMGHAGAIIMGNAGTAKSKMEAYASAGVPVADKPSEIVKLLSK